VVDYGVPVAEVFLLYMFSSMYTDDIQEVLKLLAASRNFSRVVLDPGMKQLQTVLKGRGIVFSDYKDRPMDKGDLDRPVVEFVKEGSKGTLWGDPTLRLEYEAAKLPEPYSTLATRTFFGQITSNMTPQGALYGVADYVTLGIPLGFYSAATGVAAGVKDLAEGDPEKAIKEILPALILLLSALGARTPSKAGVPAEMRGNVVEGSVETTTLQKNPIVAESDVGGPSPEAQFTLPNYKGPLSPEAARVGALVDLNSNVRGAAGALLDHLGPEGIERAAKYVQSSSAAARFVIENGLSGLDALLEANGDVEAARIKLKENAAPPALPPKTKTPYAGSSGELEEQKTMQNFPGAVQLTPKFPAFDYVQGYTLVREFLTIERIKGKKAKGTVVNQVWKGGRWFSQVSVIKGKALATAENVASHVTTKLRDIYNDKNEVRTAMRDPEPIGENTYRRIVKESPDRITIVVELRAVDADVSQAHLDAAQGVLENPKTTELLELPPVDVIVLGKNGLFQIVARKAGAK